VKTCNHLYDRIISFDNLLLAASKAQKGKRFKDSTALFNLDLEKELVRLHDELRTLRYRHGGYRDFSVFDPKRRLISAAPYRDRVVHHALCNIIEPIFETTFISDSYACRQGKGTHAAVDRYTEFARKNTFVLKCDIRKYFQSIDHAILLERIERRISCIRTLWLIRKVIGSRTDETCAFYFDGDDLFTPLERRRGIPIGNLTSQFFANVYLDGFDHYVKEVLRCKYYIRYADDGAPRRRARR
jgi:retron-type reverse transcriptase